jgi:hypothetical protein
MATINKYRATWVNFITLSCQAGIFKFSSGAGWVLRHSKRTTTKKNTVIPSHLCQLYPAILVGLKGISLTTMAIDQVTKIRSAITQ